jgi:hypothetical protein
MLPEMLSSRQSEEDPSNVANVALKLAENKPPGAIDKGQRAGYDLLARAALFRAKVKDSQAEEFRALSREDYIIGSSNWALKDVKKELGTLAYRLSSSQPSDVRVCYIVSNYGSRIL